MGRYGTGIAGGPYSTFKYGITKIVSVTPDLGWSSIDTMLDAAANPMVTQLLLAGLASTASAFTGEVGPNYRVISTDEGNYLLSESFVRGLLGHNLRYYYNIVGATTQAPRSFVLKKRL